MQVEKVKMSAEWMLHIDQKMAEGTAEKQERNREKPGKTAEKGLHAG